MEKTYDEMTNKEIINELLIVLQEIIVKPKYEYIYVYPFRSRNLLGGQVDGFKIEGAYEDDVINRSMIELLNDLGAHGWNLIDPGNINHPDPIDPTSDSRQYIFQRKINTQSNSTLNKLLGILEKDEYIQNLDDGTNLDKIKKATLLDAGLCPNLCCKLSEFQIYLVSDLVEKIKSFEDLERHQISSTKDKSDILRVLQKLDSEILIPVDVLLERINTYSFSGAIKFSEKRVKYLKEEKNIKYLNELNYLILSNLIKEEKISEVECRKMKAILNFWGIYGISYYPYD